MTTGSLMYIKLYTPSYFVQGYGGNTYGFKAIGNPGLSISKFPVMTQKMTDTLSATNLIPLLSQVYSGYSYQYNVFIGENELTLSTSTVSTVVITSSSSSSTSSTTYTFNVPNVKNGVYNISIVYNGGNPSSPIYSEPSVISSASTTIDSGSILAIPEYSSGSITGYYIGGYGFYGSASVKLSYMTYTGLSSARPESLSYGGFLDIYALSTLPQEPAGNYSIMAQASYGGQSYIAYTSYQVYVKLSLPHSGYIYSQISGNIEGLMPNQYYTLSIGSYYHQRLW